MVIKKTKEDRKNEIVVILQIAKNMHYTDIKEKMNISDPILSKYLKSLMEEKAIKVKSDGKFRVYSLTKNAFQSQDRKMVRGISTYSDLFDIMVGMESKNFESSLIEIEKSMSGLFFYLLVNGFKSGDNWYPHFKIERFAMGILSYFSELIKDEDVSKKLEKMFDKEDLNGIFKHYSKSPLTKEQYDVWLNMQNIIQNRYKKEFKQIDDALKN